MRSKSRPLSCLSVLSLVGLLAASPAAALCTSEPLDTCLSASRVRLGLHDDFNDEDDYLRWTWRLGEAFGPEVLGHPETVTTYSFCLYERRDGVASLLGSYVVPPNVESWGIRNGRAEYVDRHGAAAGVRRIRVRSGSAQSVRVQFGASGFPLDLPPPAAVDFFVHPDAEVTAQLVQSDGSCWTSTFTRDDFVVNQNRDFQAALVP